jgi:serine/threonine-protein kinase HipA
MAMFVGDKRHYVMEYIERRHFVQTVERAGLPKFIANNAFEEIEATVTEALRIVARALHAGFPGEIHESVAAALLSRLSRV